MAHVTIIGTVTARPETRDELRPCLPRRLRRRGASRAASTMTSMSMRLIHAALSFMKTGGRQADLDAHLAMPHLAPLFSQLGRLLAKPVDIRHLTMLSNMAEQH